MKHAIVIFSFNRPDTLLQCLADMKVPTDCDVHLFQDGAINPHSRTIKCNPAIANQCVDVFKSKFPDGVSHVAPINLGVALNHLRAYKYIFEEKKYDQCAFFDDDTVLTNVGAFFAMCERTKDIPDVMGADALPSPYTYESADGKDKVLLCDTRTHHIDFKAFACCRDKYLQISKLYTEKITELCGGVDYTQRDVSKIQEYIGHESGSQDWVRDKCFRDCGMTKKAITSKTMSRNVGETGVHMNPEAFKQMKFGETVINDVTGEGEIVDNATITVR